MPYVYSTLGQDVVYTNFVKSGNDLQIPKDEVVIRGGAYVIDAKTLLTPLGKRTEITDEQHEILKRNEVFKQHVRNGFIVVQDNRQKVEKVAKEHMEAKDKSAQMTPEDFESLRKNGEPGKIPAKVQNKKGQ